MTRNTKDELEATALRLFCERGIAEVSVRDIAAAMSTRESTLYRHMKSKDELVDRIFSKAYDELGHLIVDRMGAADGFEAKVVSVVDLAFCEFDNRPDLIRFMLTRQHDLLPRLHDGIQSPFRAVLDLCEDAERNGQISIGAIEAATIISGLVLQPLLFITYGALPAPARPHVGTFVKAILAAVAGDQK